MTPSPAKTKLIGSIQVQPSTVAPGQSVFIQVLDASGHPYAPGADVTITINGIEAPACYCQFHQPGSRPITVRAVQGSAIETANATIEVQGEPMMFRLTTAAPAPRAMPILQVRQNIASTYIAEFSLATPQAALRIMANKTSYLAPSGTAPAPPSKPLPIATPAVASSTLEDEVVKMIAARPGAVTIASPATAATANGTTITVASRLAPISAVGAIAASAGVSYQWDFGDGQTVTTTSPNVTHNYFPAIKAGQVAHNFHVKCTIIHDGISVTRTLVLQSAYGLCRSVGVAVPYVTGDVYATLQKIAFSGSMIVHNPETAAYIMLDQMAVVPVPTDRTAALPAPKFTKMATPITIKANSSYGIGAYVPLSQLGPLGPNICGFTVNYSGSLYSDLSIPIEKHPLGGGGAAAPVKPVAPVRFSWHFRIRMTDSGTGHPPIFTKFNSGDAMKAVVDASTTGPGAVSEAGQQTIDPATYTVAIGLSADPHSAATMMQVRSAVQAGLASVAKNAAASPAAGPAHNSPDPPPPPPPPSEQTPKAGNYCDPDNIPDADAALAASLHLSCQLTTETGEVTMPGSYQNAQAGDVILAPSGGSPIAQLLRALGQPFSHSGIMTQNQIEITHCTASDDRYGDYTTGLEGAGGIQPDVLQYGWPGSVTMNLQDAIDGLNLVDPGGKVYNVGGFNAAPSPEFSMVPPLVIKPLPENEEAARPILRKAAAVARSKGAQIAIDRTTGNPGTLTYQKGACYYSFYGYTKPEAGAGFGDPAPAEAGWAQGMSPGVCSAFIWLCLKEAGAALVGPSQYETPAELSPAAAGDHPPALVESTTLDGLFYYTEQERQTGAVTLNSIFENLVLDKEGIFANIPFVSSTIASDIADQIINAFAFGDPTMYGSSAWQNPGDANAVSPYNMKWWNPPLFGYAEPAQYLQPYTEQYTNSKWTPYAGVGTISGVATSGGAPVQGVLVAVPNATAVTDATGHYTLSNIPTGTYKLKASVYINGKEYDNGQDGQAVQLLPAPTPSATANIALALLPENFRDVVVICQVTSCDHGDDNPTNAHGTQQPPGPSTYHIPLGPGKLTGGCNNGFDYNGGGYFTAGFQVNAWFQEDLSVRITLTASITDDGSKKVQNSYTTSFNVPKDTWHSLALSNFEASGTGYHNGPVSFTMTVSNNQETS